MKRKVIHLYHSGESEGCEMKITEDYEEFSLREELRTLLIENFKRILNYILRLR